MPTRVFISHKREDETAALRVSNRLRQHGVDSYVDVLDPHVEKAGDELSDYIRETLRTCSHLMAVVSESTKLSWWVPWEIGVATEREAAISTFAGGRCDLPAYLKKWPYLQTEADIDEYVRVSRGMEGYISTFRGAQEHNRAAMSFIPGYAGRFHTQLKKALGQMR